MDVVEDACANLVWPVCEEEEEEEEEAETETTVGFTPASACAA